MSVDRDERFSLSFMDVVTCGLGGILLVFFILVATSRSRILFGERGASAQAEDPEAGTVLIVVIGEGDKPLWSEGVDPWLATGAAESLVQHANAHSASAYSLVPLAGDARIRLQPPLPGAVFQIQIFVDGIRTAHYTGTGEGQGGADGRILVWPYSREWKVEEETP